MNQDKELFKSTSSILHALMLLQLVIMGVTIYFRLENGSLTLMNILLHMGPLVITLVAYVTMRRHYKKM